VVWTPNGIDLEDWSLLDSDRESALSWRMENVDPTKRILGVFGQIKPKKGVLQLIQALADSGMAHRFHLLLVGDLDAQIVERLAGLDPIITHTALPFTDRYALMRWYAVCDAVAIPSFYDGTPNVLLESMGLGLPLVASTAGGMGDLLEDEVHGFLFHPGDPHGCRLALTRLAGASDADLEGMGTACRHTAKSFDPDRETAAYLDLLGVATSTISTESVCPLERASQ
jgi:glycosyltransferase involved in cell wall biosynthesis